MTYDEAIKGIIGENKHAYLKYDDYKEIWLIWDNHMILQCGNDWPFPWRPETRHLESNNWELKEFTTNT